MTLRRQDNLSRLASERDFDVVILGGGVNGACLYDALCRSGFRVLITDRADFGSGTSQASGMMIWGGLLYLRNLDVFSVMRLCADRDRMLRGMPERMSPQTMRYLPSTPLGRFQVHAGLWLYWLMARGQRQHPRRADEFAGIELLRQDHARPTMGSLTYEEAFLEESDSRFVFDWLAPHRSPGQMALNYCTVRGEWSRSDTRWHLDLRDVRSGDHRPVTAKMIVNCAGVWTDAVNADFGVRSPVRHAFSKGVYLALPRPPSHQSSMFFELDEHDDVITYVPWGPVSLWGPTETSLRTFDEGLVPDRSDIDYLLEHYARRFRQPATAADVVSIRCGVRALVVDRDFDRQCYPLELSRRQEVIADESRPWISCYGGKLTGCQRMAATVMRKIGRSVSPSGTTTDSERQSEKEQERVIFPGMPRPVLPAAWCAREELCCTLDDYLRRRTNIAQWIPRAGLGRNEEHRALLENAALDLAQNDPDAARTLFQDYERRIIEPLDALLAPEKEAALVSR